MNASDYAFPFSHEPVPTMAGGLDLRGMTLRDYFAAKVLQGMHARDSYDRGQASPEQRASLSYIDADAMLKAREK